MTAERAIRFLQHEAKRVRRMAYDSEDLAQLEAVLLLLPAFIKVLDLPPMDDFEAAAVRYEIKQDLIGHNGHMHAS